MSPLRGYLLVLSTATLLLLGATLLPLIDAPDTPGPAMPTLQRLLGQVEPTPQRVRVLGYERAAFGNGWAPAPGSGCDTREMMIRQAAPAVGPGCEAAGEVPDPYGGPTEHIDINLDPIEIDHVFPLSAAWDLGAHHWETSRRVAFANDPRNLVLTSRSANQSKSDDLPATWLPEQRSSRCWYVRRLAAVAVAYQLPLPEADIAVMRNQCLLREFLGR